MAIPIITTVLSYLVAKFGKKVVVSALYISFKVGYFAFILFFYTTFLNIVNTLYTMFKSAITQIENLSTGEASSDCVSTLFSAVVNAIGLVDAYNLSAPLIFSSLIMYLSTILYTISYKFYKQVNGAVKDFTRMMSW